MPSRRNPQLEDCYVYRFEALGVPFYVGMGRAGRASMREAWVRSQMSREEAGKPGKWVLHTHTYAALLRRDVRVDLKYVCKDVSPKTAALVERLYIRWLKEEGYVLANGRGSKADAENVIRFIQKKTAKRRSTV